MNYQKKIKTNSNTNVNGQECRFYTVTGCFEPTGTGLSQL